MKLTFSYKKVHHGGREALFTESLHHDENLGSYFSLEINGEWIRNDFITIAFNIAEDKNKFSKYIESGNASEALKLLNSRTILYYAPSKIYVSQFEDSRVKVMDFLQRYIDNERPAHDASHSVSPVNSVNLSDYRGSFVNSMREQNTFAKTEATQTSEFTTGLESTYGSIL